MPWRLADPPAGVIWDLGIAWASGSIGEWLHNQARINAAEASAEGATYLALATWAGCRARPRHDIGAGGWGAVPR